VTLRVSLHLDAYHACSIARFLIVSIPISTVVLVGAQSGNNLRDPSNDALKTLDEHKALLAAIRVDAAQIDQFAQALVATEKKKYDDGLKAWEAEEDRLRNERVAARKKALQEEEDRNDSLRDKLYRCKVPEVPAVLNDPLHMGEIFHVPQASLDKLASHQFTPLRLSLYLPETMDAYRDAARNVTASNAIVPVLEDDGSARWVAQANTLNPKKVIPDRNLSLGQMLKAKNNVLKLLAQTRCPADPYPSLDSILGLLRLSPPLQHCGRRVIPCARSHQLLCNVARPRCSWQLLQSNGRRDVAGVRS
jgi:hypothetical protein